MLNIKASSERGLFKKPYNRTLTYILYSVFLHVIILYPLLTVYISIHKVPRTETFLVDIKETASRTSVGALLKKDKPAGKASKAPGKVILPLKEAKMPQTIIPPIIPPIILEDEESVAPVSAPSTTLGNNLYDIKAMPSKVVLGVEDTLTEKLIVRAPTETMPSEGKESAALPVVSPPDDIEITVEFNGGSDAAISYRLIRKNHPAVKVNPVPDYTEEGFEEIKDREIERVFRVKEAERAVYNFIVVNSGGALTGNVTIRLYGKTFREKVKKFKEKKLEKNDSIEFKFLMPEAFFWDDRDWYEGEIESSSAITRFNDSLVWKEEKN